MTKIAIIGTGLAGLSAANLLKDHADITLFEKSRGVSGRMSTRRAEPYFFDHGAQYFTVENSVFQEFIEPMLNENIIERWNAHYVHFQGKQIIERKNWRDDKPRYVGTPGMNQVAKFLSKELNIHLNTKIVSLKYKDSWSLIDEKGQQYSGFDWVICTTPAPQALTLLPDNFLYYDDIKCRKMRSCFSLMLGFKNSCPFEFDVAQVTDSIIGWIAVNSSKPKRSDHYTLVVHSSEEYADAHIDGDRAQIMQDLIAETTYITGYDVGLADYKTIHGWRYANGVAQKNNIIFLDKKSNLAICGDWCLGRGIEDSFMSSYNLVMKLKDIL